ncbi:MAG: hypothetical protein KAJ78_07915, partial [Acidobacteria bacterium]|nr:hypothetical protein [Acidobacteriota bacterium]
VRRGRHYRDLAPDPLQRIRATPDCRSDLRGRLRVRRHDDLVSYYSMNALPNYPAFLQDRHPGPLQGREDYRKFLAELKKRWKYFIAEFGEG